MAPNVSTTIWLDRASAGELRAIADELGREDRRRIPLGEVIRRLIEVWRAGGDS
jgi:hypothetical protein